MKKILCFCILSCLCLAAGAIPARPGKFNHTQPDGSVIVLELHGDENFHWTTSANGEVVEEGDDGFYRPITTSFEEYRRQHRRNLRPGNRYYLDSYADPMETNLGDRRILCFLVNFSDSTFTVENPREKFHDLLNQEGYNYQGCAGSVRDYFIDNSDGQYRPYFDVYGPVTVSQSSQWYDDNGAEYAIIEAYELLKDQMKPPTDNTSTPKKK